MILGTPIFRDTQMVWFVDADWQIVNLLILWLSLIHVFQIRSYPKLKGLLLTAAHAVALFNAIHVTAVNNPLGYPGYLHLPADLDGGHYHLRLIQFLLPYCIYKRPSVQCSLPICWYLSLVSITPYIYIYIHNESYFATSLRSLLATPCSVSYIQLLVFITITITIEIGLFHFTSYTLNK